MLPLSINTLSFLVLGLITDDNFLISSIESLLLSALIAFCEAALGRNTTRQKLAILEMLLLVLGDATQVCVCVCTKCRIPS